MITDLPQSTPASTTSFTAPPPEPTEAGQESTASYASVPSPANNYNVPSRVLEAVSAPLNVKLSGTGIVRVGSPQQYKVSLSLSGTSTVAVTATMADSSNADVVATSPNVYTFTYRSRNIKVATVNDSGLVTVVGRGECVVEVISTRSCNAPFTNATPSGTEGVSASLIVVSNA